MKSTETKYWLLLDKLAEKTEGSSEYVDPDEEIDVKIAALYGRLSNPVLNDATVAFGEWRPTAVFPQKLTQGTRRPHWTHSGLGTVPPSASSRAARGPETDVRDHCGSQ